jgi:8-oxo-dGTP diphosphatase
VTDNKSSKINSEAEKTDSQHDEKNMTTVCYLERNGQYLLIHRVKKENDINKDKLIGIGGHFEKGESPEECMSREMHEECNITLKDMRMRGFITFDSNKFGCVYMFLFSATEYEGEIAQDCSEGVLTWVDKEQLLRSPAVWEGDRIFLKLLDERKDFFSLKLSYDGEKLIGACLDGKQLNLDEDI